MKNRKRRSSSSRKSSKQILSKGVETAKSFVKSEAVAKPVVENLSGTNGGLFHGLIFCILCGLVWVPLTLFIYIRTERFPRVVMPGNNNTQLSWRETKFLQTSRGCTLDNCIDWSKCSNSTSIYIYKESDLNIIETIAKRYLGNQAEIRKFRKLVVEMVRKSPDLQLVDDPKKACFFVPTIACLSVGKCDMYEGFAKMRLESLKYWEVFQTFSKITKRHSYKSTRRSNSRIGTTPQ